MTETKKKVLVIEDDELCARALQRELRWKFDVEVAHNAEQARAALAQGGIAATISDCELGLGETGVELLERSRKMSPATVRVMVSGVVPDGLGPLMVAGVVHRFIAKPWLPGQIGRAVIETLREH